MSNRIEQNILNIRRAPVPPTSKTLNVKSVLQTENGKKTGKQYRWCAAAVTAALINYKKRTNLEARDVAYRANGSYENKAVSTENVKKVAKSYGISVSAGGPMGIDPVKYQIYSNKPIYTEFYDQNAANGKSRHALGIIGYNRTNYIAINPWYEGHVIFPINKDGSKVRYDVNGCRFVWEKSLYNWG